MRFSPLIIGVLMVMVTLVPAYAVQPGERLANPVLEQRARHLSAELRCVVCQNQSIDDSDAGIAHDLRVLIRERLTAGDSDQQVLNFLVARYGEFILLKPRFTIKTLALWLSPFILLLFGIAIILKSRRHSPLEAELSDEERAELEKLVTK